VNCGLGDVQGETNIATTAPSDRKVIVVASPRYAYKVEFSDVRDHELRRAHQVAFTKIAAARSSDDSTLQVSKAIEEIVEACEAYTLR
jgi:hypothetical protein